MAGCDPRTWTFRRRLGGRAMAATEGNGVSSIALAAPVGPLESFIAGRLGRSRSSTNGGTRRLSPLPRVRALAEMAGRPRSPRWFAAGNRRRGGGQRLRCQAAPGQSGRGAAEPFAAAGSRGKCLDESSFSRRNRRTGLASRRRSGNLFTVRSFLLRHRVRRTAVNFTMNQSTDNRTKNRPARRRRQNGRPPRHESPPPRGSRSITSRSPPAAASGSRRRWGSICVAEDTALAGADFVCWPFPTG